MEGHERVDLAAVKRRVFRVYSERTGTGIVQAAKSDVGTRRAKARVSSGWNMLMPVCLVRQTPAPKSPNVWQFGTCPSVDAQCSEIGNR